MQLPSKDHPTLSHQSHAAATFDAVFADVAASPDAVSQVLIHHELQTHQLPPSSLPLPHLLKPLSYNSCCHLLVANPCRTLCYELTLTRTIIFPRFGWRPLWQRKSPGGLSIVFMVMLKPVNAHRPPSITTTIRSFNEEVHLLLHSQCKHAVE